MTTQTQTLFAGNTLTERFAALRSAITAKAAKRKTYLTTLRELESLTTRELDDLGISANNIQQIAYEAAYGA